MLLDREVIIGSSFGSGRSEPAQTGGVYGDKESLVGKHPGDLPVAREVLTDPGSGSDPWTHFSPLASVGRSDASIALISVSSS